MTGIVAYSHPAAGGLAISPRTHRILTAVIFAVLWTAGMLWRATALDLPTVTTALVVGVIVAGLVYWLLDTFAGRSRGPPSPPARGKRR